MFTSLSQVTSNLTTQQDTELQQFLTKKLTRGAITENTSHISSIDLRFGFFEL